MVDETRVMIIIFVTTVKSECKYQTKEALGTTLLYSMHSNQDHIIHMLSLYRADSLR